MTEILDITPPVSAATPVWPGDVAFFCDRDMVTTSLHVGAHADAPAHLITDGRSIAEVELEPYYGPCRVVDVPETPDGRVPAGALPSDLGAPRVLFRTGFRPPRGEFRRAFAGLSVELAEALAERGVLLAGIDTPSVDPWSDPELTCHGALGRHGIAVLEGLDLTDVEPGLYTLIALPLRIEGADGSPVRAVLVR